MSTTAYTGFRCGTRDEHLAAARIERLAPRLIGVGHRREQRFVTHRATEMIDQNTLAHAGGLPRPHTGDTPWNLALAELRDRQVTLRSTGHGDSEVDVGVTITLWKTRFNGEWLGLVGQAGSNAAYQRVVGSRGLRAYGYWNSTDDRPHGVNLRQWKKRANAWHGTFIRAEAAPVPSRTWTFWPTACPNPSSARDHRPPLAERSRPLAEARLLAEWFVEQPPLPDGASMTAHLERYLEFRDQARTDPVLQARFAGHQAWVETHLIQDLDRWQQALVTSVPAWVEASAPAC